MIFGIPTDQFIGLAERLGVSFLILLFIGSILWGLFRSSFWRVDVWPVIKERLERAARAQALREKAVQQERERMFEYIITRDKENTNAYKELMTRLEQRDERWAVSQDARTEKLSQAIDKQSGVLERLRVTIESKWSEERA